MRASIGARLRVCVLINIESSSFVLLRGGKMLCRSGSNQVAPRFYSATKVASAVLSSLCAVSNIYLFFTNVYIQMLLQSCHDLILFCLSCTSMHAFTQCAARLLLQSLSCVLFVLCVSEDHRQKETCWCGISMRCTLTGQNVKKKGPHSCQGSPERGEDSGEARGFEDKWQVAE